MFFKGNLITRKFSQWRRSGVEEDIKCCSEPRDDHKVEDFNNVSFGFLFPERNFFCPCADRVEWELKSLGDLGVAFDVLPGVFEYGKEGRVRVVKVSLYVPFGWF